MSKADAAWGLPATDSPWEFAFDVWPLAQAQRWRVAVFSNAARRFVALAAIASDSMLLERIESLAQAPVPWLRSDESTLDLVMQAGAANFRAMDSLRADLGIGTETDLLEEISALQLSEQSSPLVRLLDSVLYDALKDGASDIHLECTSHGLAMRFRVDGVMTGSRQVADAIGAEQMISRLKVMAELDIGERRVPQDGRFKMRMQGRAVDFRLSIIPTTFGEDAVIRILDRAQLNKNSSALTLEALGFDPLSLAHIRKLSRLPNGMLLVTGPTGSGKTTTLYAAISEVNTGREKIITIEDPVEYQLAGVVQVPVNEKKGLTFARGLRSILRHDPDRVMVGEIRDTETAQIAVQAALTGHLVFSTVHANNAIDVIGRFMHMGLDLYEVVSALNGVLAQRLLRLNCIHCIHPSAVTKEQLKTYGVDQGDAEAMTFSRGIGCSECHGTGFQGRYAVAEVLVMDDELRDLIAARAPISKIKMAARERGMRSLRQSALDLVCQGRSTFEELDRVTLSI